MGSQPTPREPNAPCRAGGSRIFDDEGGLAAHTLRAVFFNWDDAGCGETPLVPGEPKKKVLSKIQKSSGDKTNHKQPSRPTQLLTACHGGPQRRPILFQRLQVFTSIINFPTTPNSSPLPSRPNVWKTTREREQQAREVTAGKRGNRMGIRLTGCGDGNVTLVKRARRPSIGTGPLERNQLDFSSFAFRLPARSRRIGNRGEWIV
ncbi:hypothetical protein B0I37DRAFT_49162 [Chaetomium sp. MPI-CAGE-AT-0009]|nr:hypothetical protein B0I37DRAFT_49162 [Chaetomium sp. MPI-CAGE-AT-0009]